MWNNASITVMGNVATPVRRPSSSNPAAVASFRLACNYRAFDRATGRYVDRETSFYTVECWRGLADNVERSLNIGQPVVVYGRLKIDEWTGADGVKRQQAVVEAQAVGHNLRFGTTSYLAGAPPAEEPSPVSASVELNREVAEEPVAQAVAQPAGKSAGFGESANSASSTESSSSAPSPAEPG